MFDIIHAEFSHIFRNYFPYFLNTLSTLNLKNFNTITSLTFSQIIFMEQNAKNICKTVVSGKEQNFNKRMVEFVISILFQYSIYISAKFNTFSRS